MPLVKAVIAGGVGALAVPWGIRGGTGQLVELLHYGLVNFSLGEWHFAWSWPVFCIVTLFTWAMLKWAA